MVRDRRLFVCFVALVCALVMSAAACGGDDDSSDASGGPGGSTTPASEPSVCSEQPTKPTVHVPPTPATKLEITDLKPGHGRAVKKNDVIAVHYVGVAQSTNQQFDASYDRGQYLRVDLSQPGGVIKGWEQGLPGMKLCGRRQLVIPPELGYGAQGQGAIGPNETLVFVIDLLGIR